MTTMSVDRNVAWATKQANTLTPAQARVLTVLASMADGEGFVKCYQSALMLASEIKFTAMLNTATNGLVEAGLITKSWDHEALRWNYMIQRES